MVSKILIKWTTDHSVSSVALYSSIYVCVLIIFHCCTKHSLIIVSEDEKIVIAHILDGAATNRASIGLFLGIPYKHIELFKLEDTLGESVSRMVGAWLQRKYDVVSFGEPSWRKLVEAVASPSGACNLRLATEIARVHPLSYTGGYAKSI